MNRSLTSTLTLRSLTTRSISTSIPRLFPSNPTNAPNAEADAAHLPRDKQGADPNSQPGGSAQGTHTPSSQTPSGGPSEQSGLADPEIPKEEASKYKGGMTNGKDGPARN